MIATVTIQEAEAKLAELIRGLAPGTTVTITENDRPMATLTVIDPAPIAKPRQPGTLRGTVLYMAPDFDAPLEDFKEYME